MFTNPSITRIYLNSDVPLRCLFFPDVKKSLSETAFVLETLCTSSFSSLALYQLVPKFFKKYTTITYNCKTIQDMKYDSNISLICQTLKKGPDDLVGIHVEITDWTNSFFWHDLFFQFQSDIKHFQTQPQPQIRCHFCKTKTKPNKPLQPCPKCKSIFYCDDTCRKSDLASHKKICKK